MLTGRDRVGRQNKTRGIEKRTGDNGPPIAEFFSDCAEYRLPDPPSQILDRNGKRKVRTQPAIFGGDGDLENPEGCAHGKAEHDDNASANEGGSEKGRAFQSRGCSLMSTEGAMRFCPNDTSSFLILHRVLWIGNE